MSSGPTSASESARAVALHRIPSLDGLRAVSILMVIGLHTVQRFDVDHPVSRIWSVIFNGSLGVYIFFVISGYLITRLLLHEAEIRGSISLAGFYLKRVFRILPPLYAYVAVLALLSLAGRLALSKLDVLSALFFFHNYAVASTSWAIEHFWSLSVEEQFYGIWPLILIACLHSGGERGREWAATVAAAVILCSPALRILSFRTGAPLLHNGGGFHMHADALMFGCGTALIEGRRWFERSYAAITRLPWLPVAALALGSYLEIRFQNYWNFPLGETYTGFFLVFFLLWTVRNPAGALGRVLNARPVVHIGVLSYSMYLWQTLFLHHNNVTVFAGAGFLGQFPYNWVAILLVAQLSYLLVEQPALRLRNRLLLLFPRHTAAPALPTGIRVPADSLQAGE